MLCYKCGIKKSSLSFRKFSKRCKKCQNREWTNWRNGNYRKNKLRAIKYLGGKCKKCGYDKCIQALDFNHLKNKKIALSRFLMKKWDRVKKELDKCELLCANCHREYHYSQKYESSQT